MAHETAPAARSYGVMAEFPDAQSLLAAVRRVRDAGYTKFDAFSPFPIHGMGDALGFKERSVAPIVLGGGLVGLMVGYGLEYWTSVIAYPLNIGGRPYHSWPMFIPPAFETTILFAAISAVVGMLALNGLPQPYHPVFNAPRFSMASQDSFFLVIEAADPKFEASATRQLLTSLQPREVVDVAD